MKKHKYAGFRPTWIEISLKNLVYNFRLIKRILSKATKVMACVKADAYGHGLLPVAKKLSSEAVDYLSVASIDEAIQLRKAGIRLPILVLGMVLREDVKPLFEYDISQTICSEELAKALDRKANSLGRKLKVHIKVDTGMGRIGVLHNEAVSFVKKIASFKHIEIEGLFTHLACADSNEDFTNYQISIFEQIVFSLRKQGISIPLIHAAGSLGVAGYSRSHFNTVRPGLILYGLYPKEGMRLKLKPVLSLKTRIVYVKNVPKGWGISYGHTYVTQKDTFIATLPVGYGDGYPRNLSNIAPVIIRGKLYRVSGRVCMDQTMVDIGKLNSKVGTEVILIGCQGKSCVSAEELAELSNTIPYEIVCGLGSRIPRVYVD